MDRSVERLKGSLLQAKKMGLALNSELNPTKASFDFDEQKKIALINSIKAQTREVMKEHPSFVVDISNFDNALSQLDKAPSQLYSAAKSPSSLKTLSRKGISSTKSSTSLSGGKIARKKSVFDIDLTLPPEINEEVMADIHEIEKAYAAGCLRSSVILCGRIMETALHRKYYEITGKDILETAPGLGAGKMVAKLKEVNVSFDPGVTEQIHLINQVRVGSVHKKQEVFSPSEVQAHAIILFTLDILKKLFK